MHLFSHITHTMSSILTDLVDKRSPPSDDLDHLRILIPISRSENGEDFPMYTPTITTLGPHILPLIRTVVRTHIGQFEMNKPFPSFHRGYPRAGIIDI
jgi:hypothetical protein